MSRRSSHTQARAICLLCVTLGCLIAAACGERSDQPQPPRPRPQSRARPPTPPAPRGPAELTVLTYNVLADRVQPVERTRALLDTMRRTDADIIALQEAAPWFLLALHADLWFNLNYSPTKVDSRPYAPGGQYFLSKIPIERAYHRVLPGKQQRTVLIAHLKLSGRSLFVGTTHMESFLGDGPTRARQLDRMFPLLAGGEDALLLGDFNFGDGEPEEAHIPRSFVDVWKALHPGIPGFTWNMERSPMARRGSFEGEKSRRIDRILVRSDHWAPSKISIIGDSPLAGAGEVYPSDHFGLVATLKRRAPAKVAE